MNWWLIFITFIGVNLDFFVMLLFLLGKYRVKDVIIGYSIGLVILLAASFFAGKILSLFLPEWILGILGILPIYMALHDNDEEVSDLSKKNPILTTFITYIAVCAGCNLSIFLPILTNLHFRQFLMANLFIIILAVVAVLLIKAIGNLPTVKNIMDRYSESLMKVIYIGVGLYVFWDSGLVSHIIKVLV